MAAFTYPLAPLVPAKLYHMPANFKLLTIPKYLRAQPIPAGVGRRAQPIMIGPMPALMAIITP